MAKAKGLLLVAAAAVLVSASAFESPATARSNAVETMPVSEIRPGMKGYALTVFSGQNTDRFEVEIVDTIPNYLPQQDAILFRSNDPRLQHSGIVGGMSGSPIFIDGKLVGALAYGWRFNKDALGGITPIDKMLEVGRLPYRPDVLRRPVSATKREGVAAWADNMLGLDTSPLPPARRPHEVSGALGGLTPAETPLSVSGLGASATHLLASTFGMEPVRGGSMGSSAQADAKPKTWEFGDSVSVVLVQGDSTVASNGTVTWVSPKGDRLLAFGHSMFEDGPTNVPIAEARVHTILNSLERSVKLSSPGTIRGLMYQDRQPAIALRTDLRAPMIPVVTTIQGPDRDLPARRYDNNVAFGVDLTPNLDAVILSEAVDEAGRDATEVVLHIEHDIALETSKGPRDIHLTEDVFFPSGLIGRMMARSKAVSVLAAVLDNDFEVAKVREVRHSISMEYGAPVDRIEAVRLRDGEVRAGDIVRLEVTLRNIRGEPRTEVIPIRVPDDAGGQEVEIELAGGDYVRPYRPIPGSLDDLITTLQASYPSRAMVATIYRQSEGISTRHGLVQDVPDSVLETLVDQGSTRDSIKFKQMSRRVLPTKRLIEGTHSIKVDVLPAKAF